MWGSAVGTEAMGGGVEGVDRGVGAASREVWVEARVWARVGARDGCGGRRRVWMEVWAW